MTENFVADGTVGELFWNIADAVMIARSRPPRVLAWNPRAETLLGMTTAEAVAEGADLTAAFGAAIAQLWELVDTGAGTRLSRVHQRLWEDPPRHRLTAGRRLVTSRRSAHA